MYQWPGFKFNLNQFIFVETSMPGNIFMRCHSKLKSTLPCFVIFSMNGDIF